MIENLKGKTILIGRNPAKENLLVAVVGYPKTLPVGTESVPLSISRCVPTEDKAHCKIAVGLDGTMTLTNMKSENCTFVNGKEIVSKKIDESSIVELGKDHYQLNVVNVLQLVSSKLIGVVKGPVPTYSIRHLKKIEAEYKDSAKRIDTRRRHIQLLSSIPIGFSLANGLIGGLIPEIRILALIISGIAFTIFIYGLYLRLTDNSSDELEKLKDAFLHDYICPNPKCHHSMEGRSFFLLQQDGKCRHCGCKFEI